MSGKKLIKLEQLIVSGNGFRNGDFIVYGDDNKYHRFTSKEKAMAYAEAHGKQAPTKVGSSNKRVNSASTKRWQLAAYNAGFKNIDEVKLFQRLHGLKVDGKAGAKTLAALRQDLQQSKQKAALRTPQPIQQAISPAEQVLGPQLPSVLGFAGKILDAIASNPQVNDFINNDPIFGYRRIAGVGNNYGDDNPFKSANNDVANVAMTLLTAYGLSAGVVSGIIAPLVEGGTAALPEVITSVMAATGGGYIGAQLADKLSIALTGKSWARNMEEGGATPWNQYMTNPGGWAGSYGATKLLNTIGINGIEINSPRTVTVQNKNKLPYSREVYPGEIATDYLAEPVTITYEAPASYMQEQLGVSRYQSHYTGKPSGARSASAGQDGHRTTSGASSNVGYGVSNRVMGSVNGRPGNEVHVVEGVATTPVTYTTTPLNYYWNFPVYSIPFGGYNRMKYLPVPTVVAPPAESPYHYQQTVNPDFRFEQWYAQLPEGTVQQYMETNDPYHAAGSYLIVRRNTFVPRSEYRVFDLAKYNVPDSTKIVPRTEIPLITKVVNGAIPTEAARSATPVMIDDPNIIDER